MTKGNLTRSEAQQRASIISDVSYRCHLDISQAETSSTYQIDLELRFHCSAGDSTFLNFLGDAVVSLSVNGEGRDVSYDGERIELEGLGNQNQVTIKAVGTYSSSGVGLHKFTDPVDSKTYLYSQCEPAEAQRLFPCFDQPDLKANLELRVTQPAGWTCFSNESPIGSDHDQEVTFNTTPLLSTYLFALVAGPYDCVSDRFHRSDGSFIDLRIAARGSLIEYLDHSEMFEVTKIGFESFEEIFDLRYPFSKYDQIFTPECNFGAMENAGCVTFNEAYLYRSGATAADLEHRGEVVLHEMAHMWFGDLVTMKWWDDLWLNESFATFMATHVQSRQTKYTDAWATFQTRDKAWAYKQDQLSTTHPVLADMVDTDSVNSNFDGITYAKGASLLKQLVALVGHEAFFKGIQRYFKTHAFSNTQLHDFLEPLERESGRDLRIWVEQWLSTTGVPTIGVRRDGRKVSLGVRGGPATPAARTQPIGLAAFERNADQMTKVLEESLELNSESGAPAVTKELTIPEELLILPNYADHAYGKLRLDDHSGEMAKANLGHIRDPLARALLWGWVYDSVRDAELSPSAYLDVFEVNIGMEDFAGTLATVLDQALYVCNRLSSTDRAVGRRKKLNAVAFETLRRLDSNSGSQVEWARFYINSARDTPEKLQEFLDGEGIVAGLSGRPDLRYGALVGLALTNYADLDRLLEVEARSDRTDQFENTRIEVMASRPTPEAKAQAWELCLDGSVSTAKARRATKGFQISDQQQLLAPYEDEYLQRVGSFSDRFPNETAIELASGLYPITQVKSSTIEKMRSLVEKLPPVVARPVAEGTDELERVHKALRLDS